MLMRRRRWLRYNNSVFEDVTSYTPARAHARTHTCTRAACTHMRFSWIIYLTHLPTGRFYVYNQTSSRFVSHHIQRAFGRHTGVSYRWPINAGRGSTIYPRIPAGTARSVSRMPAWHGTGIFSDPFSIRFSRSARYSPTGSRAKTIYYVNYIKRETLMPSDYRSTLM